MAIQRMDHVGVVVDDLASATEFFVALGFEESGRGAVGGDLVDRIIGVEGVQSEIVMLRTPDGQSQLELSKFHAPAIRDGDAHAPSNTAGLRHLAFEVDDLDAVVAGLRARGTEFIGEVVRFEDLYTLCYVRGPEGIIVELAERIG